MLAAYARPNTNSTRKLTVFVSILFITVYLLLSWAAVSGSVGNIGPLMISLRLQLNINCMTSSYYAFGGGVGLEFDFRAPLSCSMVSVDMK